MKTIAAIAIAGVLIVGGVYAVRASGATARGEAAASAYFVPAIVTASIQPESGQMLLLKATNVSEAPVNVRLMIYNDRDAIPHTYKDFVKVAGGTSVSYVYEPPMATLTLGSTTVDAPEAVRVMFAPVSGGDPGTIRRVVASVQLVRARQQPGGQATLETAIVPVEHCSFEPRGYEPYTGARWYWNCAPDMLPVHERWRRPVFRPETNAFVVN